MKTKVKKSLLELMTERDSFKESIAFMLKVNFNKYDWRGNMATPPGTILDKIVNAIRELTDVPLEIPFFTTLSFISAYLNKKSVIIKSHMGIIKPDVNTELKFPKTPNEK